jgi:hypothetical protein
MLEEKAVPLHLSRAGCRLLGSELVRLIWVFLADRCFGAKTSLSSYWISLDFLGFSRPNRDFSMGYADFTAKKFSQPLSRALRR